VNIKAFFVATLSSALDLGIATPDDVVRHVTPDVLAANLPRPLWARLLTACLGASRVDATLVVETIGVPNLCEHVPLPIMWACVAEIAARALGGTIAVPDKKPAVVAAAAAAPKATPPGGVPAQRLPAKPPLAGPPPPPNATPSAQMPAVVGPAIPNPLADVASAIEREDPRPSALSGRARTPTGQRFRNVGTGSGIGRLANASNSSAVTSNAMGSTSINSNSIGSTTNANRRPQASAPAEPPAATARRGSTEADAYDVVTEVGKDDWKNALAVEDEQLVDWTASEETLTTNDDYTGRKR
jgi:hypothetical protein